MTEQPRTAGRVWREGGRLVIEYADPRLAESAVNEIRSGRFPPLPNVAVREAQAALAATPEPAPALDVERLNRAFYNTPRLPGLQETARQHIERVAAEYARSGARR